jgi:hypothetical protein
METETMIIKKDENIIEKTWDEFYETGLLMFINQLLHIFGWAILFQAEEDGTVTRVYPVRTKYRGFDEDVQSKSFIKISKYMKQNAKKLLNEVKD